MPWPSRKPANMTNGVPPPVASPPQTPNMYSPRDMPGFTEQASSARPIFTHHASHIGQSHKTAFQRPRMSGDSEFASAFSSSLPEHNTIFPSRLTPGDYDSAFPRSFHRPAEFPFEFDGSRSFNSTNDGDTYPNNRSRFSSRNRNLSQPRFTPSTGTSYPGTRQQVKVPPPPVTVMESHCSIELVELGSDYDATLENCEITIIRPTSIEEFVEKNSSRPESRTTFVEREFVAGMSHLSMGGGYDSDSDLEEPQIREFRRRQREIRRQTRMSHGSSIGKRPFSDRDDPDIEDLRNQYREGSVFNESGFLGDRRIRRRVGDRGSGSTVDPQPERIPELEEPDTEDEIHNENYALDCELPYHGFEIMEVESEDEDVENENDNGVLLYP
ncbi:hypothetical protein BROUX41_006553 [Berkeleyomyces rouxiae]|uniref:uncharacterized protein n=1 Tax=Berkeleyomyces rouxiae TaxID=2035830 RepID=UPI003B7A39E4